MKQNDLFAYASTFVSFLIKEIGIKIVNVNQIILYGSVAKGEATSKSDVDIFIDSSTEIQVKNIVDKFYSSREATIFKSKGIDLKISLKVGLLKDWKELENSIISSGIVLWGRYLTKEFPGTHQIIYSWDSIGKNRGAFLNKLYGVKIKDRHYSGILELAGGKKIGKSGIIVPFSHREVFISLFKKYEVRARHWDVLLKE